MMQYNLIFGVEPVAAVSVTGSLHALVANSNAPAVRYESRLNQFQDRRFCFECSQSPQCNHSASCGRQGRLRSGRARGWASFDELANLRPAITHFPDGGREWLNPACCGALRWRFISFSHFSWFPAIPLTSTCRLRSPPRFHRCTPPKTTLILWHTLRSSLQTVHGPGTSRDMILNSDCASAWWSDTIVSRVTSH